MNNPEKPKTKNIETYAEDMAEAIQEGGGGLVKRIIEEEEEEEVAKKKFSTEAEKNRAFTFASAALIFIALMLLAFLVAFRRDSESVRVPPQFSPLILSNRTEFLDITDFSKDDLTSAVRGRAQTLSLPRGDVAGLYLSEEKEVVGWQRFLEIAGKNFPASGFDKVAGNFFIGVRGSEGDVFFIVKTSSFVDAFDIFRTWEGKMFFDLHGFFRAGVGSDTSYLLTKNFEDGFVLNKNARILYDDTGAVALMYIFADEKSVVITASLAAAKEALLRLSAGAVRK